MKIVNPERKDKGGGIMKRFLRRIHQDNKGFTLVELLIVVAILGVLAAGVLINAGTFANTGETEGALAEKTTVQTAMDVMMAKAGLSAVTAVTTATSAMSAFPDGTNPLYPTYIRTAITTGTYKCSTTGLVEQASTGY